MHDFLKRHDLITRSAKYTIYVDFNKALYLMSDLEEKCSEAKTREDSLSQVLKEKEARLKDMESKLTEVESEKKILETKVEVREKELNDLKSKLQTCESKIRDLERQLKEKRTATPELNPNSSHTGLKDSLEP